MNDIEQAEECRCNIIRMLYDINNVAILNYINAIVSDVAKEDARKSKAGKGGVSNG